MTAIHPIRLSLSNAFLAVGKRPVLVDAGSPGEEHKIASAIQSAGVALEQVALILLTHAHRDHAGGAKAMRQMTGAPVALHPAENAMLQRGHMGKLTPVRPRHAILEPFLNRPFDGFTPDVAVQEGMRLEAYGLQAEVIETPGHSRGSVSVVLANNDALAGDLVIGGFLGGLLDSRRRRLPYFAEDLPTLHRSIAKLSRVAPGQWFLGHGGPVAAGAVC